MGVSPFPFRGDTPAVRSFGVDQVLRRILDRVIVGNHRWGTVDVSPAGSSALTRTHLTVYAPGTSTSERLLLRSLHSWPIFGVVLGLVVMILLGSWPAPIAITTGMAVYGCGFWPLLAVTRRFRRSNRHLIVSTLDLGDYLQVSGDFELLRACLLSLTELDNSSQRGGMSPVECEVVWSRVYRLIPESSAL